MLIRKARNILHYVSMYTSAAMDTLTVMNQAADTCQVTVESTNCSCARSVAGPHFQTCVFLYIPLSPSPYKPAHIP